MKVFNTKRIKYFLFGWRALYLYSNNTLINAATARSLCILSKGKAVWPSYTVIQYKIGDEIIVNNKWAFSVLSTNDSEVRVMTSVRNHDGKYKSTRALNLSGELLQDVQGQFGTYHAEINEVGLRNIFGDLTDELIGMFEDQPAKEAWEDISLDDSPTGLIERDALSNVQVKLLASLEAKELQDINVELLHTASYQLGVEFETLSMHLALTAAEREDIELVYAKMPETKAIKPVLTRKPIVSIVSKNNIKNIQEQNKRLGDLVNIVIRSSVSTN